MERRRRDRSRALWGALASLLWLAATATARADKPEGLTAQTIKLPSGPASLKGLGESFVVNPASGTGSFSVPLEVPPGLAQPTLALSYVGGRGKGALGLGFDLALLSIYRTTDKGSPAFREQDRFAVSGPGLNDELVVVDREHGLYRLKNESAFVLFVRDAANDSWWLRYPDGHEAYLGLAPTSRQTSLGRTFRWWVTRQEDPFDQAIEYRYRSDGGQLYIDTIRYQLHARDAFQNVISFTYAERPDVFTDYRYGEAITTRLRMQAIEMRQGTRLLRRYTLGYEDGLLFSLLSSVSEEGENGEGLPSLTFEYVEPTVRRGELVQMRSLPPLEGLTGGWSALEDVTGDGLADLLITKPGSYVYFENLDGRRWAQSATAISPCSDVTLSTPGVVLADVDGDARRDVVYPYQPGQELRYCPARDVLAGKFLGYAAPRSLRVSEPAIHFGAPEVKMADLDADGRTDLLYQKPGQDLALLNENDALVSTSVPELPGDADFSDARVGLADFNGDGVLDLVRRELGWDKSLLRVWHGLGAGRYAPERAIAAPKGDPQEFHLFDINRDGQEDLVRISGTWAAYYLNDGRAYGPKQASYYGLPAQSRTKRLTWADMNGNGTVDAVWLTTDGALSYLELLGAPHMGLLASIDNGMGLVTRLSYRASSEYAIEAKLRGTPWATTLPFPHPVVAETVTSDSFDALGLTPTQTRTTYEYHDGYYDGQEREFRGFAQVVTTEVGDEQHDSLITEAHFHVGKNPRTGADEEALKGRPYLEIKRDGGGRTLQTREIDWELVWLCREDLDMAASILPSCAGHPDRAKGKDELVALPQARGSLTGHWEGTSSPRWVATRNEYDAWGQLIQRADLGEVAFQPQHVLGEAIDLDHCDARVGDDEAVSETDRLYDVDHWLIGLPTEQRLLSQDGVVLSRVRLYYDGSPYQGLPLGVADKGKVTRQSLWLDTEASWIDVARYEFDTHGLVVGMLDANGNRRDVAYDGDSGMFPVLERIQIEHGALEFTARYDTGLGAPLEMTDANGHSTRYVFDGLRRITAVYDPDAPADAPLSTYAYEYGTVDHPISRIITRKRVDLVARTYRTSYLYTDGAGRPRLTKVEAEEQLGYVASGFSALTSRGGVAAVYDAFAASTTEFEAAGPEVPHTTSRYDALGRVVIAYSPATEQLPSLATRSDYLPLETRVYDERDTHEGTLMYPVVTRVDGLGRVRELEKSVDLAGAIQRLVWSAKYDARGKVIAIADPRSAAQATDTVAASAGVRTYEYDSRGQLIRLDDPNLGTITYGYDHVGNRVRSIDALGQEQLWEYGMANRLARRLVRGDASGAPDYEYTLHYDAPDPYGPLPEATNTRGRLTWVEYPTGTEHYGYDARGRQIVEAYSLWDPGRSSFDAQQRDVFRREVSYDDEDKLASVRLPGGFEVHIEHNLRQLASRVTAGFAGDTREVVSDARYDHRGELLQADYGNGIRFCRAFDARGELTALATGRSSEIDCGTSSSMSAGGVQNLRYQRGLGGNIAAVTDLSSTRESVLRLDASYHYDRLNQLVYTKDALGERELSYDTTQGLVREALTNASSQTVVTDYRYGERGAGPAALTARGDESFDYDALGRLQAYRGYTLRYDGEGHLVQAMRPERTISFFYGPGGERRLIVVAEPGKPVRVHRAIFDEYQQRDGEERWIVDVAGATAEVLSSEGIEVDARLLDELTLYLHGERGVKPLPVELMDLDGQGDGFTERDLELATRAYWNGTRVGSSRLVWRFSHADQLGSHTHATDSAGDLVALQAFEAYGGRASVKGLLPLRGYAGGINEVDEELGLTLFGARYYAPALRRWITPDLRVGGSPEEVLGHVLEANLYSYAANNPITHRDPSGHQAAASGQALMSSAEGPMSVATDASSTSTEYAMCGGATCEEPYAGAASVSGENVSIRVHDVYDKAPKKGGKVVAHTTVYNSEHFAHALGDAQTDIDGWRLADFYDHANVGPGAVKCAGGPCVIKSGVGQGYRVIATTLARDPRLPRSDPDRYVSPVEYNYTTIPGKSYRTNGAFAGVKVGDAVVIRYKDRVVYGFVADVGNSFKFGENALRTQVGLGLADEAVKVKKGKFKIYGHDARDVEYVYLKNSAHLLRDSSGVLLPQSQIDGVVKGLYERLFGPVQP